MAPWGHPTQLVEAGFSALQIHLLALTVSQFEGSCLFWRLTRHGVTSGPFLPLTSQGKRMNKGEMTRLALDDTRIPCCLGPPPWPADSECLQCHPLSGELVLQRPLVVSGCQRQRPALGGARGACFTPAALWGQGWCPPPSGGQETGRRQGAFSLLLSCE